MEGHVTDDEIARLAAACDNRRRRSQAPRGDDEITRLAAACDNRRRPRSQLVPLAGDRWSKLPKDVLFQAVCRLPRLDDRLRLAAVCRHWHAVERQHLPYSLPKLCLALPDGSFFTFKPGSSSVLEEHRDNVSRGSSYRGATSSQLLYDTGDCCHVYSLVNPFTLRKRPLPIPSGTRVHEEEAHHEAAPEEGYWSEELPVRKLAVRPDDGLVAAILGRERSARVALCNPESAARSWFLNACDPWRWYADMAFFDGKLYALTNDEELLALEIVYDDDGESGRRPRISRVERVIDGAGCRYALWEHARMRYLVVRPCGRGLLMVTRIMMEYGSTTYQFAVFQADLRSSQWVYLDSLGGDEAVFVGRLCSRAVLADRHGLRNDLIFFLDDSAGMEVQLGLPPSNDGLANVYDMKDGSVSKLLPMRPCWGRVTMDRCSWDRAVPATWLFSEDLDTEEE